MPPRTTSDTEAPWWSWGTRDTVSRRWSRSWPTPSRPVPTPPRSASRRSPACVRPRTTRTTTSVYWQAHLWETLLRYRRAYRDPACPDRLRAGYDEVAEAALRLAERATSGFPLSPIDSVGCHSTLKELRAGALGLEATVAALADGSGAGRRRSGPPAPPTSSP